MQRLQLYLLTRKRQAQRTRPLRRWRSVRLGGLVGLGGAALLAGLVGMVLLSLTVVNLMAGLPAVDELEYLLDRQHGILLEPTTIYDRSGEHRLLALENPGAERRYLPVDPAAADSLSPYLIQVTLALHDPTFWQNPGAAWWSPFDPLPQTLAERLVDDLLMQNEAPGLRRTLRMRILAAQAVKHYGRTQVLEWYLNSANYGHLAYGAESAAWLYLGKSAADLTLIEAALIVPVTDAPALNPIDTPDAARERARSALAQLLERGLISPQDYLSSERAVLSLRTQIDPAPQVAPAYTQALVEQLSSLIGRKTVERGGLKVVSTLNYDLQLQLDCAARTQLVRLSGQTTPIMTIDGQPCAAAGMLPEIPEGTQPFSGEVQAAGVLLDPATGQVLALLGDTSPDGRGERINGHQPGSMLTPFVAVAAFARGLNPANLVWDVPASQPAELEAFSAADYDYHGPVRLRSALASDYMTPISQLLMQVGPETVWRLAEPLGLNLLIGEDQPEALLYRGGYITPVELAQAYAVFANQGLQVGQRAADGRIRPALYIYITDTAGKTVAPGEQPARAPVLSAQLAYLTHHVLSESGAVPQAAAESALGRPAALKTGQAQFGREVWAAGYTPQRLGVVWLGLADDGPESLAPEFAAGLWQAVMAYAGRGLPVESAWPAAPDGITMLQVCEPSGKLPTPYCPLTVEEVFAAGSEPLESDDLYRPVQINRETGRLATVFTPFDLVVEDVYLYLPAEAGDWRPDGLKLPPEQYDALQAMTFTPGLNTAAQAGVSIGQPANLSYVRGQTAVYGSASGEEFEAYRLEVGQGLNPERWYLLKEAAGVEIGDGLLGVWDTRQYADGLYALSLVAQYADQQAALTAVLVTVDNTLPQARLLYPEDGQTLQLDAGETINLQAEVTDEIGIERVEWVMDGVVLGETRNAPHTQEWQASAGPHKLWLRAFDLAGNMGQSQPVMFEFSQP